MELHGLLLWKWMFFIITDKLILARIFLDTYACQRSHALDEHVTLQQVG